MSKTLEEVLRDSIQALVEEVTQRVVHEELRKVFAGALGPASVPHANGRVFLSHDEHARRPLPPSRVKVAGEEVATKGAALSEERMRCKFISDGNQCTNRSKGPRFRYRCDEHIMEDDPADSDESDPAGKSEEASS